MRSRMGNSSAAHSVHSLLERGIELSCWYCHCIRCSAASTHRVSGSQGWDQKETPAAANISVVIWVRICYATGTASFLTKPRQ
jgi:hypothetical protein